MVVPLSWWRELALVLWKDGVHPVLLTTYMAASCKLPRVQFASQEVAYWMALPCLSVFQQCSHMPLTNSSCLHRPPGEGAEQNDSLCSKFPGICQMHMGQPLAKMLGTISPALTDPDGGVGGLHHGRPHGVEACGNAKDETNAHPISPSYFWCPITKIRDNTSQWQDLSPVLPDENRLLLGSEDPLLADIVALTQSERQDMRPSPGLLSTATNAGMPPLAGVLSEGPIGKMWNQSPCILSSHAKTWLLESTRSWPMQWNCWERMPRSVPKSHDHQVVKIKYYW